MAGSDTGSSSAPAFVTGIVASTVLSGLRTFTVAAFTPDRLTGLIARVTFWPLVPAKLRLAFWPGVAKLSAWVPPPIVSVPVWSAGTLQSWKSTLPVV